MGSGGRTLCALHDSSSLSHLSADRPPWLQAESGQRAAAQFRQQLVATQQQLEAQSLVAAERAAEAARLEERLRQAEAELGRALAERADLSDAGRRGRNRVCGRFALRANFADRFELWWTKQI